MKPFYSLLSLREQPTEPPHLPKSDALSPAVSHILQVQNHAFELNEIVWRKVPPVVECFDALVWFVSFSFKKHLFRNYSLSAFEVPWKTSLSLSSRNSQPMVEEDT